MKHWIDFFLVNDATTTV